MDVERTFKPRPRIEALSDLIFGLALSIGALTFIGQPPASFDALLAALGLYGFSFLILVSVWLNYSTITSVLPAETETMISLNIVLLFLVSVEPFLFSQLFAQNGSLFSGVSVIYSVDLAAMFIILGSFNHAIAGKEKNHVPKDHLKRYRSARNYAFLIAAIFLISTLPFFASVYVMPLRVYVWILALVLGWVRRIRTQITDR